MTSKVVSAEDLRENIVHKGLEFTQDGSDTQRLLNRTKAKGNLLNQNKDGSTGDDRPTKQNDTSNNSSSNVASASETNRSTQLKSASKNVTKQWSTWNNSLQKQSNASRSNEAGQSSVPLDRSERYEKIAELADDKHSIRSPNRQSLKQNSEFAVTPHVVSFPEIETDKSGGKGDVKGKKNAPNNVKNGSNSNEQEKPDGRPAENESNSNSNNESTKSTSPNSNEENTPPIVGLQHFAYFKTNTYHQAQVNTSHFPNSPVLLAHSIQMPAMTLGGSTHPHGPSGVNSMEARGN